MHPILIQNFFKKQKGGQNMLIVAKQDNVDNLYAIWTTITDRFLGVNLDYEQCIKIVMDYKGCSYEDAKEKVNYPQPFDDIAKHIYWGSEPHYASEEPDDIQNAVRLVANHYKKNKDFRNAFIASIASSLKEITSGTGLYDVAKKVAERIIGEE